MEAVEEFCLSAQKQWPNCLIQFEDFPTDKVPAIARSQTTPTWSILHDVAPGNMRYGVHGASPNS